MDLILLATEATDAAESGGGSGLSNVVILSLIVALAVFAIAYLVVGPGRRRAGAKRRGDIPLAMRPYHSDEELETTGLERAMAWGVALSLFSAVFVAAYWMIEPDRINDKIDEFYREDLAAGRAEYQANCATCHGADLSGGSAPNPYNADAPWPAPDLTNVQARYAESEVVTTDIREFLTRTIKQGRPGTPMPAWGSAYQGPLNDMQVESIVEYIMSLQDGDIPDVQAFEGSLETGGAEVYANNCARCHGDDLQGQVGPQLQNVFERYGWQEGDEASRQAVVDTLRGTILNGRNVPTGAMMPPFRHQLDDQAVGAVIDYIFEQQVTGGPRYGQLGGPPSTGEESTGEDEE